MADDMKESTRTIRSMALVSIVGLIRGSTRATGSRGSSMDWGYTSYPPRR